MQAGLSATLNVAPAPGTPTKADATGGSDSPSAEAIRLLEQRLQLAQEEVAQLRETIVKQVCAGSASCLPL